MNKTLTATYTDKTTLTNVIDDMENKDMPRENLFADEDKLQVIVRLPDTVEPEIKEILERHKPIEVHQRLVAQTQLYKL